MSKQSASVEDAPLARYMKKTRKAFLLAALFSFGINMMMLIVPLYSLQVLDRVLSSRSIETLLMLTILMVVVIIIYGIFYAVRNVILSSISEWLDKEIAPLLLSDAITKASLGNNVSASQSQRDLAVIRGFITTGSGTLLDAPWSILFLLVIYMINPILGLIAVIGIVILLGFGLLNEFATKNEFQRASKEQINSHFMADTAGRNAEAIEAMGMTKNIINVWNEHQYAAADYTNSGSKRANVIQSFSRVLRMLIQIATTGVGGYLALNNELSTGGMIASSIIVGRALAPFENAIGLWKSWISARESYQRVNASLDMGKLIERGTLELPQPEGRISVENIIYTPARSAPIIKGVTFSLQPGQSLGIIGPSAAGKSTLAKLMIGLLPPTHGAARLDGAETFKWNRENFGKYTGYLPQAVDLFTGTIKDNIARMNKSASMESVVAAAQMAECHEMILRLPQGYETVVNPQLNSLSPGQRQRIGLARAIYGNPCFVVLDEPNSNLDGDGERALLIALQRMKQAGMTFVVVAHRPSIVANVDVLLALKGGVIEKFGATADVIQQFKHNATPSEPVNKQA